jgi:hypothetical protein
MPPPATPGAGSPNATAALLNKEARFLTAKNLLSMRRAKAPIGKATIRRELDEAVTTGSVVVRARYYHVHADQEPAAIAVATAQLTQYLTAHGISKRIPIISALGWSAEFLAYILECNANHITTSRGAEGHLLIHPPHADEPTPGPDSATELHALAERILSHLHSLNGTDDKRRWKADTLTGLTHRLGTTRELALQAAEHLAAEGHVILEMGLLINVKLTSAVTLRTYTAAAQDDTAPAAPAPQPAPAADENAAAPVLAPSPDPPPSAQPLVSRYLRGPARTPANHARRTPMRPPSATRPTRRHVTSLRRLFRARPRQARPRWSTPQPPQVARAGGPAPGPSARPHRPTLQHHPDHAAPWYAAGPPTHGTSRRPPLRLRAPRTGSR